MGAHPLAPSRVSSTAQDLQRVIEGAPERLLGPEVARDYDNRLPFLLKVLAAATPLSLQAHPSLEQAAAGFAADEALGIPLAAPERNYRDRNHKPELLCALSEFWALCGFRQVSSTLALLDELAVPELLPYRDLLAQEPNANGLSRVFSRLMQAPRATGEQLSRAVTAACQARSSQSRHFGGELGWVARLGELYPGDVGVVSSLLLNLLKLEPGEAVYLPAGNLHAYLAGTGVEIMASSDNVLRGGLTPKHVNVAELLRVLDFAPLQVEPLRPIAAGAERVYPTPAREFQLSYFDLSDGAQQVRVWGPEIWLVTRGRCELEALDGARLALERGRSAFVSADTGALRILGNGRIFRATAGPAH